MSHVATAWATKCVCGSPAEKAILVLLADAHNGHDGRCFPSTRYLERVSEFARATVVRAIGSLEEKGFIRLERSKGRSNEYVLNMENGPLCWDGSGRTVSPLAEGPACSQEGARGMEAPNGSGLMVSPPTESEVDSRCDHSGLTVRPGWTHGESITGSNRKEPYNNNAREDDRDLDSVLVEPPDWVRSRGAELRIHQATFDAELARFSIERSDLGLGEPTTEEWNAFVKRLPKARALSEAQAGVEQAAAASGPVTAHTLPEDFVVAAATIEALGADGIDADFARSLVGEFIVANRESGDLRRAWQYEFMKFAKRRHAGHRTTAARYRQADQAAPEDRHASAIALIKRRAAEREKRDAELRALES